MDLSLVVADELRAILRKNNRTVSPVALTQVAEAFRAVRAALGSDVLYQEFVTKVTTRLTAPEAPQQDRSWQTRADNHFRALYPEYYKPPEPAPEEEPVFKMRPRKFVL